MGNADSVLHMGMLPGKPLSPPSFDSSSSHPGASACSGTLGKDSGGLCLAQRRWAESIGWEGARDGSQPTDPGRPPTPRTAWVPMPRGGKTLRSSPTVGRSEDQAVWGPMGGRSGTRVEEGQGLAREGRGGERLWC